MGKKSDAKKREKTLAAGIDAEAGARIQEEGGPLDKLAEAAKRLSKEGFFAPVGEPTHPVAAKSLGVPSLKKRLSKAIAAMSVEDAQSAIADGADIWRGTLFYGDCGIEGDEEIAAFEKKKPLGYSGKSFVFQAWAKGVGKLIKKSPEKVAAMAVYLEGLGFPLDGDGDDNGRSWLEGRRPAPGKGRERTAEQIAKERRAAISLWCSTARWASSWSSVTSDPSMEAGIMSLAKRWHEEPAEAGGLPAGEWRELILAKMLSEDEPSWGDTWEMMAGCSQTFGETFTAAQWETVASISSKSLLQGSYVRDSIKKILRVQGEKIGAGAASKIMALAVSAEDVEMLALIASRAQSVHWVDRDIACEFLSEHEQDLVEATPSDVSMLALALVAETRMIGKKGRVSGRSCFEALASVPEAVEAAVAAPSPRAMAGADEVEFMELALRFPGIDKPDAFGNNVAHWWAVAGEMDKCKRKRFLRLLNSPLRHLMTEKNNDGETPLSLMQKILTDSERKKWAKNFAAWEKEDLAKSAEKAGQEGIVAARPRRSL